MTITLTKDEVAALEPCDMRKLRVFGRRKRLNALEALERGASIRDLLWVAGGIGRADLCVRYAVACAERVAHLDTSGTARAVLDAARAWIDDPSEENRRAALFDAAAYAASAADYAPLAAPDPKAEREAQRLLFMEIFG